MFKTLTGPGRRLRGEHPGLAARRMGAINGHGNARSVAGILRVLALGGSRRASGCCRQTRSS